MFVDDKTYEIYQAIVANVRIIDAAAMVRDEVATQKALTALHDMVELVRLLPGAH